LKKGVRVSLENFAEYDRVQTIPMYAVRRLVQPINAGVD
jgi:hypothetical protein